MNIFEKASSKLPKPTVLNVVTVFAVFFALGALANIVASKVVL